MLAIVQNQRKVVMVLWNSILYFLLQTTFTHKNQGFTVSKVAEVFLVGHNHGHVNTSIHSIKKSISSIVKQLEIVIKRQ